MSGNSENITSFCKELRTHDIAAIAEQCWSHWRQRPGATELFSSKLAPWFERTTFSSSAELNEPLEGRDMMCDDRSGERVGMKDRCVGSELGASSDYRGMHSQCSTN